MLCDRKNYVRHLHGPVMCAPIFPLSLIWRSARETHNNMKLCCTQRHHIIACASRGKSQGETFRLLQEVYGNDSLSRSTCRRWYVRALQGDKSGCDKEQPRRKPTARNLATVHAVHEVVNQDRRATIRQVAAQVNISKGSAHTILKNDLQMKRKAPKFVPRILTQAQKSNSPIVRTTAVTST